MTDEVVPRSETLGNLNGGDTPSHEINLYPLIFGFLANLVDLEPFSFTLVEPVASNGTTRSHISQHGTNVVRPQAITSSPPVESDSITWICVSDEISWSGIGTASECRVLGTLIRVLCADSTNDAGGTWDVALENLALDGNAPEDAMCGHEWSNEERSEEKRGELHCIVGSGSRPAKRRIIF